MKILKNKKMDARKFRNIFANSVIAFVLLSLFALTYAGGTLKAFSTTVNEPVYNGDLSSNKITLMINVYWGNEYIEPMLDTLKKYNVKTTFFIGGSWAEKFPNLLIKIKNEGHEIANHGYLHKDHDKISQERNIEEIQVTHNLVKELLSLEMNLFAPPSGAFNQTTLNVAASLGYKTILWTRDTIDWRDKDENLIYSRATNNAKGGDLILMHPTEKTALALEKIIKTLQKKGFKLTTVSDNLMII